MNYKLPQTEVGSSVHLHPSSGDAIALSKDRSGKLTVTTAAGAESGFDTVVIATGRAPNSAGLALEKAGVQVCAGGFVKVDEWQQTTAEGV
jgi:pyruvate/2-oxoglutarate dehydrogenase complex dihydrolipoamide dehydrogenase (E3) component